MHFSNLVLALSTLASLTSATPPGPVEERGLHAHIHFQVDVYNKDNCWDQWYDYHVVDHKAKSHHMTYSSYHPCHKMAAWDAKSYNFKAYAHADKAEQKQCFVQFFKEDKCQDWSEIFRSKPVEGKDYQGCTVMGGEWPPRSMKIKCDF